MSTVIDSWRFEMMHADRGDELIVRGHRMGRPDRTGKIVR